MIRLFVVVLAVFFFADEALAQRGSVSVRGHFRSNGTYVAPHFRSAPDGNFSNNWSTYGNVNPYTGKEGTLVTPPARSGTGRGGYAYTPPSAPLGAPVTVAPAVVAPLIVPDVNAGAPSSVPTAPLTNPNPNSSQAPLGSMSTYMQQQKARDIERASFWKQQGYTFDPTYMTAYSMDQKVQDIQRARYWQQRGYAFNPDFMTAYSMDQKVKDIERAKFWKVQGYEFNPDFMTAYSMDQKVKDIERANFWKERGYSFNPDYMTAYSMDQKVKDIERAKFWKERGFNFDPNYMSAYSMDRAAATSGR